jgi:GMP synthase (glutamine-hydrolysing)
LQTKILILDHGSQYTQLLARRVRELDVYCEIHPFSSASRFADDPSVKGVISAAGLCFDGCSDTDLKGLQGRCWRCVGARL